MRELKIFAIVAAFTLILYWGVEPFAHSQMHKHVEGNNLVYNGKVDMEECAADKKESKKAFWDDVQKIADLKGDPVAGEGTYAMCMGCHMEGAVNMGGVTPPSLEHAGAIYDKNFLIALIKDPAIATNVDHTYPNGTMLHPMGSISTMVTQPQDIANVVAYLQTKKAGEVTPKEAFTEACGRCHANRYGGLTQLGEIPKTKSNIKTGKDLDRMKYDQKVAEEQASLAEYLGKLPPDLSIIYRARSEHFLHTFIEDPQSQLPGTAMPRTGLNEEGMEKVLAYLEETGDSSKQQREAVGPYVLIFFIVFTFLALLWKKYQWRDVH
ncbi:MAG: cytochrome c1 [Campylobacterales bacterium]|nr:cytochrome c1 [Campylobacterales bacterium]